MIQADGLKKLYGSSEAVSDISFSIDEGQIVGFLGPNGAGKTTTMRMLTTFIPPSSGTASVAGYDICKDAANVRRSIGYLPETPPLYPELKVNEYLRFVGKIQGLKGKTLQNAVAEVMERCLVSDVCSKLCGNLSKGYRQRVGLAGALIHKPKVIILDEPTSGLDPAQIIEIRKLIKSLSQEHTVVLSTHILTEVTETCTHAIIISKGKLAAQGSIAELTEHRSLEERFLEVVAA